MPPVDPMLAKLARELPEIEGAVYEPKWDGFRALVFRDGDDVRIDSRDHRDLARYFPELVPVFLAQLPSRCVVDGEIVVAGPKGLDFNLLQQRIHPAASRIDRLARETPASYVLFDVLALGDRNLCDTPMAQRRTALEAEVGPVEPPLHITPATTDPTVARGWLDQFVGAGLDGVMVKDPGLAYQPGKRVMVKVKHERTADCVVAGYRPHKDGHGVGSLLLGLFDGRGTLHYVGVCTGFTREARGRVLEEVEPYRMTDLSEHPWAAWADEEAHQRQLMPGTPSRWAAARAKGGGSADWVPLRPDRVAEVRYEHLQGARFRNPARFVRWRDDRDPASCTYGQLVEAVPVELTEWFR